MLGTQWQNRIDPKFAEARGLATAYAVADLTQHLFLIVDGGALGVLRGGLDDGTGRRSLASVSLAKPGAKIVGDLVFEIPAGAYTSADLRFYDDNSGYMKLALAGEAPAPKFAIAPQKNAVMELGIAAVENPAKGVVAPAGFRAIALELRGRSTLTIEADPPPYDAAAAEGAKVTRVNLLDLGDLRTYLHVLADGDYACPMAEQSTLGDAIRFVPEFFTGGRAVFLVPADAKSLELCCEIPHASTAEGAVDLPPMIFPISGTPPKSNDVKAALAIKDEMFEVAITSAKRVPTFGMSAAIGSAEQAITSGVVKLRPGHETRGRHGHDRAVLRHHLYLGHRRHHFDLQVPAALVGRRCQGRGQGV